MTLNTSNNDIILLLDSSCSMKRMGEGPIHAVNLNSDGASRLFINPVRGVSYTDVARPVLVYDSSTKEITYNNGGAKTFVIQHPLEHDKYLVHACLEGPEVGVYYRGSGEILENKDKVQIQVPNYVDVLAKNVTAYVTPVFNDENYKSNRNLGVGEFSNNKFTVYGKPGKFNWVLYGERNNINTEPNKSDVELKGHGPYKWI